MAAPEVRRTAALLLAFAASLPACGGEAPVDARPNVLLITVDTLRADRLGSYGYELPSSPRLDRLARESVVFERAIAASAATAPSHASIMTSKYTRQHSVGYRNGATRVAGTTTMAEIFREHGWATAGFVGNIMLRRRTGFDAGFDVFDDELTGSELNRELVFERVAEDTARRALGWLEGTGDAPFFLWVHYQDPHGPYEPPPGHRDRFHVRADPDERPLPTMRNDSGWRGIPAYQRLPGATRPSEYESRYADEIFYADRWIGALITAVEEHRPRRGSVVLFTSDHGESFGENDRYFVHAHASTPDLAHVPLILRAPGLEPERRRDAVHHVDVMPTLLELAGLPVPAGASGVALGPYLRDGRELPERLVYCDIGRELSAYQRDGFVRVLGLSHAWDDGAGAAVPPVWFRYRWKTDGAWSLVDPEPDVVPDVAAYFGNAHPMEPAGALEEGDSERLRALGYVIEP